MRPIRRIFGTLAVVLVVQLFVLVILFQLMGPPTATNPADVAGAIGLIKENERPSKIKRGLFFSHHITGVNVSVTDTESTDSEQLVGGNDLHRNSKHSLEEKKENRIDEEEAAQRKMSKEINVKGEKAPRKFNVRKRSLSQGKNSNDKDEMPANVQIEKDRVDSKEVTGLRQATVRDNATRKPISLQSDSIELFGGKLRRNTAGRGQSSNTEPQNHPQMSEKEPESRRVPRLPSRMPNQDSMENNHELMKDWEQHQLKVIRAKNKIDDNVKRRLKMYDVYWKSLDVPGLSIGGSVEDYVKHIQASAKIGNLTYYLQEYCDRATEILVECTKKNFRKPTRHEEEGRNIMYTLRTTLSYHDTRLGILFETWLTTVYPGSVFLVTDGEDPDLEEQLLNIGMHYVNAQSGSSHGRTDLCCKAGVEVELMFLEENDHFDWFCHVDDDMYLHTLPLTKQFSKFEPRSEPIYFGRSGSDWGEPRVIRNTSLLGKPGQRYHFAVGGMYCMSRAMLELARPYLVGCEAFSDSCNKTEEPEDVTVGLIIGVVLKNKLTRTQMIYSHGLDLLSAVPIPYLRDQIAFSHGFGSLEGWHEALPNVVFVPGALFSIDDDITQFKSIHCHIYPTLHWCVKQKKFLVEEKRKAKKEGKKLCVCAWQTYLCCEVVRDKYQDTIARGSKEIAKAKYEMEMKRNKNPPPTVKPG